MKSKLFRDPHGLDAPMTAPGDGKLSVCLRLDEAAYAFALAQSRRLCLTSGEYIGALLLMEAALEGDAATGLSMPGAEGLQAVPPPPPTGGVTVSGSWPPSGA